VSSNALEADERPWEIDHLGGHRVRSEYLIDLALTFISAKGSEREHLTNRVLASCLNAPKT